MASTKKRFAINVSMNWAATAVSMIVPFFLTPFVVRHLGSSAYGVWILAVAITSYLGLLDLGLRSAVIRFVSKAQAQGEPTEANRAIAAALWLRVIIAGGVSVVSATLAYATPHFFKIPPELRQAAQITVLMCALGVAITLVTGVFGAVLTAIHRFDLLSSITMGQTVFRAGGVLILLRSGRGLVSLAYWEAGVILIAGLTTCFVAWKIFPACRIRVFRPDNEVLRMLWSYSVTTFVFMMAVQVIVNTDSIVVGAFLSVGMVTFFTIGASLVGYAQQVSGAVSSTFIPMASGLEASGRYEDLQKMLIRGTQAMLGLALPIAVALFFRGKTFITLWMGPQYGQVSETILRILMISLFLSMADATAGSIMMAMGKHKGMTRWAVYEAIINLGLSIVLVKTIGLNGVAWGTSLSMLITHLSFWPREVKKMLGVSPRIYLWNGWGKVTLCAVPFAAMCALTDRIWSAPNLLLFFGQILLILPVYALSIVIAFWKETRMLLPNWKTAQ